MLGILSKFVFFPSKYPEGLWDVQALLGAADVWLDTPDGVRLHAWSVAQEDAGWVTLHLHGNAGNITHRYPIFHEIAAAGSAILALDYRGYGKSSGQPMEKGLYRDAETAYNYLLKTGYRPEQIILHGESLGTAVAVDLASRRPCAAVVLEAPFTSAKDVARSVMPWIGPMFIRGLDSRAKIRRIHAPILFIQGDRDEIIPIRLGQALFAAANEPKSFWIVQGAGHNDIVEAAGANYRQRLRSFYGSLHAE
ncbi:MAG: alpha/beta hydrolase [Bryobacteraceae bacterium]